MLQPETYVDFFIFWTEKYKFLPFPKLSNQLRAGIYSCVQQKPQVQMAVPVPFRLLPRLQRQVLQMPHFARRLPRGAGVLLPRELQVHV